MKTGISRKIDELGRIVIPKEIRNNLNILTNEEIEFHINNNEIILKKHTKLENLESLIHILMKHAETILNKKVYIVDKMKFYHNNQLLNEELLQIINENKDIEDKLISIEEKDAKYHIFMLKDYHHSIGAIFIESKDFNELDEKLIHMLKEIFSYYLAQ